MLPLFNSQLIIQTLPHHRIMSSTQEAGTEEYISGTSDEELFSTCSIDHSLEDTSSDEDVDSDSSNGELPDVPPAINYIASNRAVFISMDLEHGGQDCGITQLSAQLFRFVNNTTDRRKRLVTSIKEKKSYFEHHEIIEEIFNKYVKPPSTAKWDQHCINTTTLNKHHPKIQSADNIEIVWQQFIEFLHRHITSTDKGILVTWNGTSCDLDWLYRITQTPESSLSFPSRVVYSIDPYQCIRSYKSCKFNPTKSKLESLSLSSVYKYAFGYELSNAHDSIFDVKAQTKIVLHKNFQHIYAMKNSIKPISCIFNTKTKNRVMKLMEPERPVHGNWKADEEAGNWKTPSSNRYLGGSQGGGKYGPSNQIMNLASKESCELIDIYLAYADLSLWKTIAKCSQKYANEDWVSVVNSNSNNSNTIGKRNRLKLCNMDSIGARHRQSGKRTWDFTTGYVIAWHGSLIYHGAKAGPRESMLSYWKSFPHGTNAPFIQNTFPKNVWEAARRFMHFNDKIQQFTDKKDVRHDPLFKIRPCFEHIMNNMTKNWVAGERICIDESMIKYMGRAVYFIQYNPKKPIKHGIKVFVCCCAYTGHILSWEVCFGKDYCGVDDSSAKSVCDRLILRADLQGQAGRILFTDNWYTSIALAKHLFFEYKWLFVGTITPTDKKCRVDYDIPFLKLSKGALSNISRGWSRRATIEIAKGSSKALVQCTTWKDKKQVMFLHTNCVEPTTDRTTTKRYVKGRREKEVIQCPPVQQDYTKNGYNGVDRNDRDSADYTVSLRTNRWYLRKWFWTLDRVNHCTYLCVKHLAEDGTKEQWKRYLSKQDGRRTFQIDLAIQMMDYGIRLDWGDVSNSECKPKWMRQIDFIPCDCKVCFFCKERFTGGIYHAPKQMSPGRKRKAPQCSGRYEKMYQRYCEPCYNERRNEYPNEDSKVAKHSVSKPSYGCTTCKTQVCKHCWDDYQHKYEVC